MPSIIERPSYKKPEYVVDDRPLFKKIHWVHVILLSTTPLISLYGIMTTKVHPYTFFFTILYYIFSGLGITAGYHRLWSHVSYKATRGLEIFLAFAGCAAVQGSIFWWSRDHRVHHRYTDTPRDPYNALEGFYHSHMGWMLVRKDRRALGYADTTDLKANPVIRFQHKYYPALALLMAIAVPTLVCGLLWGDYRGGYFFAGITRMVVLHHATFCVNSLAHTLGRSTYDDSQTAKDSVVTAVVTLGEGYHNFHHEFPKDYRNAIRFYQYDPTKWFIRACSVLGLASELYTFPSNEIEKGYVEMRLKEIRKLQEQVSYGVPLEKLPVYTEEEFMVNVRKLNKKWMVIGGVIYDVENFIQHHPGGVAFVQGGVGKDMTEAFNGGVYKHHRAAHNLLSQLSVGTIKKL
ncbi:putative acyl-CoA desaturase [Zancudomyces culisetae]|uniref:Acyl-CoA desaturase n=1 Tax=Zancudomyces culisetae TaxID=1213189 RepID=A0A1R1PDS4_ZANCU|nr:putative acyl-CoA desaturase [Zancudomyces culisetae]OMH79825.1 putative acyl-CoA desaturase [Zancudomyces culisetae]|eukprot:OMH79101.1 putative acyl-CoA desaturase [Zancudomyces culisetae]